MSATYHDIWQRSISWLIEAKICCDNSRKFDTNCFQATIDLTSHHQSVTGLFQLRHKGCLHKNVTTSHIDAFNYLPPFYQPFSCWTWVSQSPFSFSSSVCFIRGPLRMSGMNLVMGCQMPFLSPNQQCQCTEGNLRQWLQPKKVAWPRPFFIHHWTLRDMLAVPLISMQ